MSPATIEKNRPIRERIAVMTSIVAVLLSVLFIGLAARARDREQVIPDARTPAVSAANR